MLFRIRKGSERWLHDWTAQNISHSEQSINLNMRNFLLGNIANRLPEWINGLSIFNLNHRCFGGFFRRILFSLCDKKNLFDQLLLSSMNVCCMFLAVKFQSFSIALIDSFLSCFRLYWIWYECVENISVIKKSRTIYVIPFRKAVQTPNISLNSRTDANKDHTTYYHSTRL